MHLPRFALVALGATALVPLATHAQDPAAPSDGSDQISRLDAYIIHDTSPTEAVLPTARPLTSVFGTELSALDTPRSVSLLSTQLMKDLDIRGPLDFVRGVSGAYTTSQFGAPNLVDLRGQSAEIYQNGVRRTTRSDGMPLSFNGVEAIDVVKGPASVVYGTSALVGGYVNLVEKRPHFDAFEGYTSFTYGSWDTMRWQVDAGGPIIKDKFAFRFSYEGENSDSYYRYVYNHQNDFYLALSYVVSPTLRFEFNNDLHIAKYVSTTGMNRPTQELIDDGLYYAGQAATRGAFNVIPVSGVVKIPRSITLVAPGDHDEGVNYTAQFDTYLTFSPESWLVNRDYFEYYTLQQRQLAQRYYNNVDFSYTFDDRLEYHLKKKPAGLENELVTGLDVRYMKARGYGDFYNEYLNATDLTGDPNAFPITSLFGVMPVPGYDGDYAVPGATYGDPLHPFSMASTIEATSVQNGLFAQDTVKFNDRWSLLAGGRFDLVYEDAKDPLPPTGYTAKEDSIAVGMGSGNASLTFKPTAKSTYYATFSYSQSFAGTAGGLPASLTSGKLTPASFHIENYLYEIGAKYSFLDDKLYTTVAAFNQIRSQTDVFGNTSKVEADGGEADVTYQPFPSFYLSGGISYLHAIVPDQHSGSLTRNVYDAFAPPYGTGVGSPNYGSLPYADRRVPGSPLYSGNLSARYKHSSGFGVSANLVATDSMPTSYLGNVSIPAQFTLNAALFYEQKKWDARVSFLNVTDEKNWTAIGSVFGNELIQADLPFHVEATVRYKF